MLGKKVELNTEIAHVLLGYQDDMNTYTFGLTMQLFLARIRADDHEPIADNGHQ